MTRNDINPKYLFCLDMYGATDKFINNMNRIHGENVQGRLNLSNRDKDFLHFIRAAFKWPIHEVDYWVAIMNQNEPEIKRLSK